MTDLQCHVLPDGSICVCLTDLLEGRAVCCTVSSWHLVEEKRRQLEDALRSMGQP